MLWCCGAAVRSSRRTYPCGWSSTASKPTLTTRCSLHADSALCTSAGEGSGCCPSSRSAKRKLVLLPSPVMASLRRRLSNRLRFIELVTSGTPCCCAAALLRRWRAVVCRRAGGVQQEQGGAGSGAAAARLHGLQARTRLLFCLGPAPHQDQVSDAYSPRLPKFHPLCFVRSARESQDAEVDEQASLDR